RFVPHLDISFDWWRISLENGIGTIPAQTTLDTCYNAAPPISANPACLAAPRTATGDILNVAATNLNLATIKTAGWDASVQYSQELGDVLGGGHNWGNLTGRLDVTRQYLFTNQTVAGQPTLHIQNTINNATPAWHANISLSWSLDKLTLGVNSTY